MEQIRLKKNQFFPLLWLLLILCISQWQGLCPRTSLGCGFPRSLLEAPPGRRDYLTICEKGGLQNFWLFKLQLFSVIVKKKLIIFSSKPPPLSPVQTITKFPKTTHLAFSVFTVFKTIIKRQKGVGDEGFFPAQHLKSNSIGKLLFSSGYFPSVPSSY